MIKGVIIVDNASIEKLHDCVERVFSVCLYCDSKADCVKVGDLLCQSRKEAGKQLCLDLIATDVAGFRSYQ